MDIEAVAHSSPEKIETITIDPATGLMPHHGRAVAAALGLTGDLAKQSAKVLAGLYAAFVGTDASQIEINPLAVTDDNQLLVLDAKVAFDSNAMFRHKDLAELRDLSEEDRAAYRSCWQKGLTGGANFYRVSPLHPDTPEKPGKMALVAAALRPEQFHVNVPTQIVWGTADRALMPILLDGIEEHVSDLRLHRIEGAGHWLARENADEVNAVIRAFLAS